MTTENSDFDDIDLEAFKTWLRKFAVPCIKCSFKYDVPEKTIETAKLTGDSTKPFSLSTHDIYACSNPKCDATFSYPDSDFVNQFLKKYQRPR